MKPAGVTPNRAALACIAIVTVFVILWPMGIARDYMNHLARTHIEGHLASDPALQAFFGLSFSFIPDLTMDLIVPWLSHIIGTYNAGAVTIWMAFLLPPLAGLALAKTLHGRVSWVSLLGFLTVFNVSMDWGLINYAAASGLALFAFILWIRMSPGWLRTLVFLPLGLFLAVNHAIAFLMFGFLAAAWVLLAYARAARDQNWGVLVRSALFDLSAMLGGLAYIYLATQGADDLMRGTSDFFSLEQKAYALSAGTEFYNRPLGLAVAFITIALVGFGLRNRWFRFAPNMAWVCAAFLALNILMPTSVLGIWGLHLRFTNIALIIFAASVVPAPAFSAGARRIYAAVFCLLATASLVNGAYQMARIDQQARDTQAIFASLPVGSKLLSAFSGDGVDYAFVMNASAMAVIDRSAYVPGLFTNTSPVDIRPEMAALHMPQSQPLSVEYLTWAATMTLPPSQNGYWSLEYARGWPEHWDYLVYFKTPDASGLTDLPLCQIAANPDLILYRIGMCSGGSPMAGTK